MPAKGFFSRNTADKHGQRKRVLFLIPSLRGGGAERIVVTLLRHLNRSKFKLALAVVDARQAAFLNDIPEDVEFIDLGCRRVRYAVLKILILIWKRRPDVVFSTLGHLNLALAMLRPLLPRAPRYIARETNVVSQHLVVYRNPWVWGWMYRRFCGRHDAIICQSQDMLNDLVANYALPHERTVLIHNPVDVERIRRLATETCHENIPAFEEDSDSVQLIAAGRLVHQKGFDLLIEALALLRDTHICVTILGQGPLRAGLERLAGVKGVADRVRFAGFQANPYAWYARADAFVHSSRYEGFPNVILEALACGVPVIATPATGGTREILDGIPECAMAKEVSSESLADAISEWLEGNRSPVPQDVVAPYQLSTILPRYARLLSSL